jgi:DNA-3-methyladenine glycosylase II
MTNKKSRLPAGPRIIETEADLRDGVRALRRKCAIMRRVHDLAGDPPLRRRPAGFEGLARIIVGQQVSVASATAIWDRTAVACHPFEPAGLLALKDTHLAGAGLSRPKIRALRAIAAACRDGLDLARLDGISDAEVHAALTEVTGIGPWTADVYIMFCLGRADGWARATLPCRSPSTRWSSPSARTRWRCWSSPSAPWRGVAAGCCGPTTPRSGPSARVAV